MNVLRNLEELFVKFHRLNNILKDNWNDDIQEEFDGDHLSPIATEWNRYQAAATDMSSRVKAVQAEIDEDINSVNREIRDLSSPGESSLNGCVVYGFNFHQNQVSVERHFIVEREELNFLTPERLRLIAVNKIPVAEDAENFHSIEPISIY